MRATATAQPSPADRRRQANEQRILDAARELLLERTTIEGLSLREVARRADFTPGALYRYFSDRDELLSRLFTGTLAVFAGHMERAEAEARAAAKGVELSAGDRLIAFGLSYLDYARDHRQDLTMLFEAISPAPSWAAYIQVARPFTLVVAAAREGVDRGELTLPEGLDASRLAYLFWAFVHGMAMLEGAHLANLRDELSSVHELAVRRFISCFIATGPAQDPDHERSGS
jgi:AcrR family transcriptional regulator